MVSKFQEANQLQRSGQLEEAVGAYRQAIAQNPDFYWSYHNLGETLCRLGRLDEAIASYQKALELNPISYWSHYNLGQALEKLGRREEAIACYQRAVVINPSLVKMQSAFEQFNQKYQDIQIIQNSDSYLLHNQRILYIIHDGGGGMVYTSFDLLKNISRRATSFLIKAGRQKWEVLQYVNNEVVLLYEYNFQQDWNTINDINSERNSALEEIYQKLKPSLVHIRVLLGTGPLIIDFFKEKRLPIIFSFHDFSAICPSIHLINNGDFCFGDCKKYQHENDCKHLKSWFAKNIKVRDNYRNLWSKAVSYSIYKCDAYVVTSNFTQEIILSNYPMLSREKFHNIEHGRDFIRRYKFSQAYNQNGFCDLVFFGALNEAKGCSLVLEMIKINDQRKGILRFNIVGNIFSNNYKKAFLKSKNVILYGQYERNEITNIFKKIKPTLTILPSIWPETYSHTLTESWIHGIPVLGTSYGAIGERISRYDGGWILDPVDPHQWYETILSIIQNQEDYVRKVANIQKIDIKTVDQMTDDYCSVYSNVLKTYQENQLKDSPQIRIDNEAKISATRSSIEIKSENIKPNVKHLKTKLLELGFTELAYKELENLAKNDSNPYFQRQAAWELAVWHANQYNKRNASECLKMLAIATKNEKNPDKISRAKVLEAECYDTIGDFVTGKELIKSAVNSSPNADLYIASANLEQSILKRLEYVNKALELFSLSKIVFYSNKNKHPFDCLIPGLLKSESPNLTEACLKVTVIVPAFNSEETISIALNSLLNQTWTNLEILVVDDCSIDDTAKVVENYTKQDSRIRLIRTNRNQGPYVSRNLALEQASGEFITCHDADDWSHPEKIEIQVTHLLKSPNSLANISSWVRATNDLKFYRRGNPGFYIQLNISSLMFRRHPITERLGYWDSVRFGADSEFINRIKRVFGSQAIEEILAVLSFGRSAEHSLTENESFGYPGFPMGARKEYRDSYLHYHSSGNELKYQFPQIQRPFPVPEVMLPARETTSSIRRYLEVIFASDFRIWDKNTARVVEEIINSKNLGVRVGLVQMSVYDINPSQKIDARIREILDGQNTQMIVYGEKIDCDELMISNLSILKEKQRYIPDIRAAKVSVIVDLELENNHLGDIANNLNQCAKHLQEYFDTIGVWYPINHQVRSLLSLHGLDRLKSVTWAKEDWISSGIVGALQNYILCFDADQKSYIEIPHDDSLSIVDELTVEFFLYLNKWPNNWTSLISKGWDEKHSEFNFRMRGEDIGQLVYGTGTDLVHLSFVPGNHMRLGQWTHIAFVRKVDHYVRIYINGVLCNEKKTGILQSVKTDANVYLMASPKHNSFISGQLRDLRIWNIARPYENKLADLSRRFTGKEKGLVGYWRFNEGHGQCVNNHVDVSRNQAILHNVEWCKSTSDYVLTSKSVELIDIKNINSFRYNDDQGVTVIMPCIDTKKAMETADILSRRAGMYCKILVVYDTLRQGFIKTLNDAAARVACRYIVYLAEDAFPGRNWLRCAYESLEKSGKGLLAFNDGKWSGKIASFGMIRTDWVKSLYNGHVLCPHYKSHAADNELTVIARACDMHLYKPECTL
ncbi:MAG: glycosyltransferase, partial [Limnoraphis robusta]